MTKKGIVIELQELKLSLEEAGLPEAIRTYILGRAAADLVQIHYFEKDALDEYRELTDYEQDFRDEADEKISEIILSSEQFKQELVPTIIEHFRNEVRLYDQAVVSVDRIKDLFAKLRESLLADRGGMGDC